MSKVSLKFWARIKTRFIPHGNDGVKIKSKIVFSILCSHSFAYCYFNIKVYICRRKIKTTKRQGNTMILYSRCNKQINNNDFGRFLIFFSYTILILNRFCCIYYILSIKHLRKIFFCTFSVKYLPRYKPGILSVVSSRTTAIYFVNIFYQLIIL